MAVYVVLAAGATMMWLWAPPSDQEEKLYVEWFTVCGDGALTELLDPTTTVVLNGVACALELTARSVSLRPAGLVLKVSTTVLGSSRRLAVEDRPPESVAVS